MDTPPNDDASALSLERFFELSLDLLCIAGVDGYFKKLSSAWETALGYSREELLARRYIDFVHPEDREATLAEAAQLEQGVDTISFSNRYRTKDGSYRWLEWRASSPRDGHIHAVARDATEHRGVQDELIRVRREIKEMAERLRAESWEDELTGLRNRRGFLTTAESRLALARRTGNEVTIVFADIDGMKAINDQFGHAAGDDALRETAKLLSRSVRDSDVVGRLGGDEFVLLLWGGTEAETAVGERIARALDNRARRSSPYAISLSLGTARFDPANARPLNELLAEADRSMYRTKRARVTPG